LKLIVQVPCYNEEDSLPLVLASIPRQIDGVDQVEVLIIDDGCTDGTVTVARRLGVEHIVHHASNRGLAATFQTGLDAALRLGADIIVNTDGDNQYPQEDIPRLIAPILAGAADIVIADRQTRSIAHFSPAKKVLQALGSWTVRRLSGTNVPDVTSGFRAYSREAALRTYVLSQYSYTVETVIQAGMKGLTLAHQPVTTHGQTRPSRLFRSTWSFVGHQATTIMRVYATYKPLQVFSIIGGGIFLLGMLGGVRYLYFLFFTSSGAAGHVQSLILSAVLLIVGFQVLLIGLLADLIGANRRLIEETLYRVRRLEADGRGENPMPRDDEQEV
jgi:glycosyltransferase involved in cell wall biosynthesis